MKTNSLSFALLFFTLLLPAISTAHSLDCQLSLAIFALRSQGYHLFPNAIAESYLLPSQNTTLTFFSSPDSLFFSSSDSSLFRFVSPFRLPASRLRILSYGTCLKTLLPHHHLSIQRAKIPLNGVVWDPVTVDGMRVSLPDLYIGSSIVVHGLDGVFPADSKVLQIEKTVTQYISSWRQTGLLWSKNGTNQTESVIMETGNPWLD